MSFTEYDDRNPEFGAELAATGADLRTTLDNLFESCVPETDSLTSTVEFEDFPGNTFVVIRERYNTFSGYPTKYTVITLELAENAEGLFTPFYDREVVNILQWDNCVMSTSHRVPTDELLDQIPVVVMAKGAPKKQLEYQDAELTGLHIGQLNHRITQATRGY